jgi:hypothetical protein
MTPVRPDKSRLIWSLLTVCLGFFWALPASAGQESHGGGALICLQKGGTFDADLLDLREALATGHEIPRSAEPVESQIRAALNKLEAVEPRFAQSAWNAYFELQGSVKQPDAGMALAPPIDAMIRQIPRGCFFAGVAIYRAKEKTLDLDPVVYAQLDATGQAALWVHEAIYKVLRDQRGATDSRAARRLTGRLFSTAPLEGWESLPKPGLEHSVEIPLFEREAGFADGWVFRKQCEEAVAAVGRKIDEFSARNPAWNSAELLGQIQRSSGTRNETVSTGTICTPTGENTEVCLPTYTTYVSCTFILTSKTGMFPLQEGKFNRRLRSRECREAYEAKANEPSTVWIGELDSHESRGFLSPPSSCQFRWIGTGSSTPTPTPTP